MKVLILGVICAKRMSRTSGNEPAIIIFTLNDVNILYYRPPLGKTHCLIFKSRYWTEKSDIENYLFEL